MKSLFIIILCLLPLTSVNAFILSPGEQQVQMKKKSNNNTHTEVNIPADMPDVYYNSELGVITIVDYANVTYYVTIYDDWWNTALSATLVGGGTISASSLSSGDYVIEITTSWNNQYEGTFTVP